MEKTTFEQKKAKIRAYLDEGLLNINVLYDLINFALDNQSLKGQKNILGKIGYSAYDVATPYDYTRYLNDAGISEEITRPCIFDYTKKSFGELSIPEIRYVEYLRTNLINYEPDEINDYSLHNKYHQANKELKEYCGKHGLPYENMQRLLNNEADPYNMLLLPERIKKYIDIVKQEINESNTKKLKQ